MSSFSILLVTYNRPSLLLATLKSLSYQTYRSFSVHLVDNGSDPPVNVNEFPDDLDLTYTRFSSNQHPCDAANAGLKALRGTHLAILADDDAWSPHTLEIVAEVFSRSDEIESLSVGFNRFNHDCRRPIFGRAFLNLFNGHLYAFDGPQTGFAHCSFWDIGPKNNYPRPRMSHPSASFFKRELIERTVAKQGELFVKPFGDVGYLGCCFNTAKVHYLDLPLSVLGQTQVTEMRGAHAGQRLRWLREVPFLEHSPLKGCSFVNMGVDAHLKVLHRNGITQKYDCNLRSEFFRRHLAQVATDQPWTDVTIRDLNEGVSLAVEKMMQERGLDSPSSRKAITDSLWIELEAIRDKKIIADSYAPPDHPADDLPHFDGILDYAVWQEKHFAIPKYRPARRGKYEYRSGEMPQTKKKKKPSDVPVTFLVSVYNEEARIHYALEHAIRWADEIIVVNKSSTDRTKEICLSYGDRVKVVDIPFSPRGHDDAVAISLLPKNDWTFYGTASEIPTRKLIERAKQILVDTKGELDLIYVPRKMYSLGVHSPRSPWYVSNYPFLVNRKKAIITNVIHHNYRPRDPKNTARIEYADDCCVYHCTHPSARDFMLDMTDYFEAEAQSCQDPEAKIKDCFAAIAHYEKQLREGGKDLLGAYCAWPIYQLGTILFIWEKQRGLDVRQYYQKLKDEVLAREWLGEGDQRSAVSGQGAAESGQRSVVSDQRTAIAPFLKGDTKSAQDLYQEAQKTIQAGDPERAIAVLQALLAEYPDFALAHNDLAVLCYNRGEKEVALRHYEQAARLNPANPVFQKNLADFYYVELGRVQDALTIYQSILAARPKDVETLLVVGHICVALKRFDDAQVFYSKVLEIEPENTMACENLQALQKHAANASVAVEPSASEEHGDVAEDGQPSCLVSAIVSTYNSERFIRGCLEDLEAQTIADKLEIIVVDSASPQNEKAIVEEFQQRYKNIVYIRTEERENVYAAWNRAIRVARGKYVTNANTDDRHRRDALEIMANTLEQNPDIGLVYANLIITDIENETFENCTPAGFFRWHDFSREVLLFGCYIGPQPMWRKSIHEQYGYFDERFVSSGDWEFWLRIAETTKFQHIAEVLGLYLRSPESIEHRNVEKRRREDQAIFDKYSAKYLRGNVVAMQSALEKLQQVDAKHPAIGSLQRAIAAISPINGRNGNNGKNGKSTSPAKSGMAHVDLGSSASGKLRQSRKTVEGLTSIILAGFDHVNYAKKCVRAIQEFTPEAHEIVFVVEDLNAKCGWLKKLIKEKANYRLVQSGASGLVAAYNKGIAESNGEFIVLLDSEASVFDHWLGDMLKCLSSSPDVGIVGPLTNIGDANARPGLQQIIKGELSRAGVPAEFAKTFREKNLHRRIETSRLADFCLLCKRELIERIGSLDDSLGSLAVDDFCLRAGLEGYASVIAGDVIVDSRKHRAMTFEDRRRFAEKWSMVDPNSPSGKKLLSLKTAEKADELYQRDQTDQAVKNYLQAIRYNPDDTRNYAALARLLLEAKHDEEALEILKAWPAGRQSLQRAELLANCKQDMGDLAGAEAELEAILTQNSSATIALNLKGLLASRRGENDLAEMLFRKAIESDPGEGVSYAHLAELKWDAGDTAEALRLFEKGFILSPTRADIFTIFHAAATAVGEFERAETAFREACLLHPFNRRLRFLLIDLLQKQGKDHLAMTEIEEMLAKFGAEEGFLSAALAVRNRLLEHEGELSSERNINLSLCMIVKDEAMRLPQCLRSVKNVVDEMIVVDTGSTDNTKKVAQVFGAKVYDFQWNDSFAEARNFSLSKATGKWILVLDADEVLGRSDVKRLKQLVEGSANDPVAYLFETRNYTSRANTIGWHANVGENLLEEAGTGWISSVKVRLFPNREDIRFEYPVHEMVDPCLRRLGIEIKPSKIPIHHYGKLTAEKNVAKGEAYYQLGRRKLAEMGSDFIAIRELAIQAGIMGKYEEAIELWEKVLSIQPNLAEAFVNMGTAFWFTGRYSESRDAARKAMELAPKMKEAHYNYAISELHLGNPKTAIPVLENLQRRLPAYLPAQFMLAAAYCCAGRKEEGIAALTKLRQTSMRGGLAAACTDLAKGLISAQNRDFALAVLEGAIRSNNANKETFVLFSECLKSISEAKVAQVSARPSAVGGSDLS